MKGRSRDTIRVADGTYLPDTSGRFDSSADTLDIPGDLSTIQAAIKAASPGEGIIVTAGKYGEEIGLMGKAVTLCSAEGGGGCLRHPRRSGFVGASSIWQGLAASK